MSCLYYQEQGKAFIEKTPEPMKTVSKANARGQFMACFTKSAQPDYKGTLAGGRAVVFEAKHTDSDRINAGCITDEQAKDMEMHFQLEAKAFVLVSFGMQDFYRIPWRVWREMQVAFGNKYIAQWQLDGYRVHFTGTMIDFLREGKK
jgi:recombination protein U